MGGSLCPSAVFSSPFFEFALFLKLLNDLILTWLICAAILWCICLLNSTFCLCIAMWRWFKLVAYTYCCVFCAVFVFCLCFCIPGAWNVNVLTAPPLPFAITLCCHSFHSLYLSEINLYTCSVNSPMIIFYRELEAGVLHDCVLFSFHKAAHVCTRCMSSSVVCRNQGHGLKTVVWLVKPWQ